MLHQHVLDQPRNFGKSDAARQKELDGRLVGGAQSRRKGTPSLNRLNR